MADEVIRADVRDTANTDPEGVLSQVLKRLFEQYLATRPGIGAELGLTLVENATDIRDRAWGEAHGFHRTPVLVSSPPIVSSRRSSKPSM